MKSHSQIIGCLCAVGCEVLFGFSYIFTKQLTGDISELFVLAWRFIIAFIVMSICVFTGLVKINLKGKQLKPLIAVAFFSPLMYFIGETVGISNTTASESGIFLACIPVVSLVASTWLLRKKPSRIQIVGICLTLAAVILTVLAAGFSSRFSLIGYIFLAIAVLSYALYSVFVEKAEGFTGAEITYFMIIVGAVAFPLLALAESFVKGNTMILLSLPFLDMDFLLGVLYQGVGCSVVAFFLNNVAIAKIGVNRTASFIGVATVVSILAGAVWLDEPLSLYQLIGALIILLGVSLANMNSLERE